MAAHEFHMEFPENIIPDFVLAFHFYNDQPVPIMLFDALDDSAFHMLSEQHAEHGRFRRIHRRRARQMHPRIARVDGDQ